MKRLLPFFVILLLLISACAQRKPIHPTIDYYAASKDFMKYQRMAILPFSDAPGSPNSGQIVQGLANQMFAKWGFNMVERNRLYDILNEQRLSLSGIMDQSEQLRIGKLLGVKSIVVGEVGQYSTQQRHTDTTYFPLTLYGKTSYYPIQGQQWMESYVSIALRVIDVETGQLIYSGSGQYAKGLTNPPQQLAQLILEHIIGKWILSPGASGFAFKGNTHRTGVVDKVMDGSPADKAGIRTGDRIIKINNRTITDLQPLEYRAVTWSNPGEIMSLDIVRLGKNLHLEIVTEEWEKVFKQ